MKSAIVTEVNSCTLTLFIDLRKANFQGANLEKANLQGANLWEVNLQGANLKEASLQGSIFYKTNLKHMFSYSINKKPLTKKEAEKLIKIVKNSKYRYFKNRRNERINSIDSAIDKDPITWLKEQDVILGKLTKEEVKEICKSLTSEDARNRIGCDKN